MKQGTGLSVYSGVAIGPAVVYRKTRHTAQAVRGTPEEEQKKFEQACVTAKEQLSRLYEQAKQTVGEEHAAIIEVQMLMLEDLDYLEGVAEEIAAGEAAAEAALNCGEMMAQMFASLDDEYMKARSADIRDASRRVSDILSGAEEFQLPEGSFLLAAEDLSPSETIQLPRERILAFVTRQGSSSSHTAILARTLNIPSLVQADIDLDEVEACQILAVDGFTGQWFTDPDTETLEALLEKQAQAAAGREALEAYRGKASVTPLGKKVLLCGNIGSPEDAVFAMKGDAEGIGLMRSEFLYLGRDDFPTEEDLFSAYRFVVEQLQGRPLVIRTLDIGADKQADYFNLEHEENPALGYRGIRICLTREDIFRPQMRAIYRASAYGPVSAMFPMIISVDEVRRIKAFCETIQAELREEGIPFGEVELGIMIETPAAAVISRDLAKEVQFFSVGTNDLTQYTLAIDRQNAQLDSFYDAHHPAVMSLLEMVVNNAHAEGIWAGICGELGADASLTETFLRMGYDELSVSPGRILELRKKVCESEV